MTRGHPPYAAIAEAMAFATRRGYRAMKTDAPWLGSDFMAVDHEQFLFVRVRREKSRDYRIPGILNKYGDEIAGLRAIVFPGKVSRELWVRGPDRTWHRYLVTAGGVDGAGQDAARNPAGSGR